LLAVADKPRVKAPRQRSTPAAKDAGRRRLALGVAGGAGAAAVVAIGLFVLLGSGGTGEASVRADLQAAGCTLKIAPGGKPLHSIRNPDATSKQWNTFPPTSGPHYAEPAIFGVYNEPLQQARVIHNLEHGGVFIQYGDKVPESTVAELQAFYDDHKPGTLLAPLPQLGKSIALGAWVHTNEDLTKGTNGHGYLAKCTKFDDKAFSGFFSSYQFKGSHVNNPDLLLPGQ
jgi:Protein of unknown function (DUF3105)